VSPIPASFRGSVAAFRNCILAVFALLPIFALPFAFGSQSRSDSFLITTLSSRTDMISGGDVLVQVAVPPTVPLTAAVVKLNGNDVTASFRQRSDSHTLIALLSGLKLGANSLEVFNGQKTVAQAALRNFPITGPMIAGPQEHPFACQTTPFDLPDGQSIGPPLDDNCTVRTVVSYVYKSTEPLPEGAHRGSLNLKPLTNLKSLPSDVAMTTTTTGKTVPYVVRVQTGTANRSIYQFAVLSDPTKETEPSPFAPPKAWNGRLIFGFGGGCVRGWYRQGYTLGADSGSRGQGGGGEEAELLEKPQGSGSAVISDAIVGRGYAEVGSTLNVAGNSCNDVLSAETAMMVKERFIKSYGKPAFTFGRGGSGGSYQQNQIADRYPGLLDGIIPSLTFPDVQELTQMLVDSRLLNEYFARSGDTLTPKQKLAIAGVAEIENITSAAPLAGRIHPTEYCPPSIKPEQRYDAVKNPKGTRCDVYDHNSNIYGKDPTTGHARRPIDNVGVQYGLAALNDGVITPGQFLDLNEKIGGYDSDGNLSPKRAVADPLGLRAAYQNDLITYGTNLALVPIIDVRPYRDKLPRGDNHLKYHSYSLRARLERANGTSANDVMVVGPATLSKDMENYAIDKMDQWLTNISSDTSGDPLSKKIIRAKPSDLTDSCWTASGERIVETQTFSGGKCNQLYPTAPSPRMVAGETVLGNSILKCQLRPIDPADYKVGMPTAQLTKLKTIFPQGVCDWSKPGAEQQPPTIGAWHAF
jgi:hypothetical protein